VDVRVSASECVPAVLARSTRARLRPLTHESLREPERDSLLAHAARAVQEQRTGQRITTDGVVEAGTERRVAVEGEKSHASKLEGNPSGHQCVVGTLHEFS